MPAAKILVLYNRPMSSKDHPAAESEHMVVDIAKFFEEMVAKLGYQSDILGIGPEPGILWEELKRRKPDAILNLYEGTLDDAESESYVAGLLQWSGIPFTGCPPQTLSLARAKHLAKLVMKGAGLPTANFFVVTSEPVPACTLTFPVIVKPATQDASVGIEHNSVCENQKELDERVRHVLKTYGPPVLVEEFINGREIIVAVTETPELRYLPPAEIMFAEPFPGRWPILTYSSKWKIGSADYETTPPTYPAVIPPELAAKLGNLAIQAFRLLGGRDYARVDFRLNAQSEPFILELNPNPEISDDACFGFILQSGGVPFMDFVSGLVEAALRRGAASKI